MHIHLMVLRCHYAMPIYGNGIGFVWSLLISSYHFHFQLGCRSVLLLFVALYNVVFMLCTCACVHVARVLLTCVCVHVAYTCPRVHVVYVCLCSCCIVCTRFGKHRA